MEFQIDFQSKVCYFFEQLVSTRDESHKQISDIIKYHDSAIKEGINNLVKKVSDLQDELSIIRKERNVLLETVENLNGEIRHLNDKIAITAPEDIINQEITEDETIVGKKANTTVHDIDNSNISNEADEEEMECSVKETNSNPDVDEISKSIEDSLVDFACSKCNFAFSSNENMIIHLKNVHPKLDIDKAIQGGDEKVKQLRELSNDGTLGSKMLDKMRKYACKKCEYASSHKNHYMMHIKAVHEKIRHNACGECSFATSLKSDLKKHIRAVHDKIRDYVCEYCDFATSYKGTLNRHIKEVHDKIRNNVCDECGFATSDKRSLIRHIRRKHAH